MLNAMVTLGVIGVVVVFAAHLVVDWVYMFFAPFYLPRIGGAREKGNPFKDKEGAEESAGNPFAGEAKARGVKVPGERDG